MQLKLMSARLIAHPTRFVLPEFHQHSISTSSPKCKTTDFIIFPGIYPKVLQLIGAALAESFEPIEDFQNQRSRFSTLTISSSFSQLQKCVLSFHCSWAQFSQLRFDIVAEKTKTKRSKTIQQQQHQLNKMHIVAHEKSVRYIEMIHK